MKTLLVCVLVLTLELVFMSVTLAQDADLTPQSLQNMQSTNRQDAKSLPTQEANDSNPTALTTELVRREILLLEQKILAVIKGTTELNQERIKGILDKLETRIDAIDESTKLLQTRADKVPSETDIAVSNLKQWVTAKLDDIAGRINSAGETALQKEAVNKSAINDALVAVKQQGDKQNEFTSQTATKTENNFSKQVDGLLSIVNLNKGNSDRQLTDLTERIAKIEGVVATIGAIQSTVNQINDRVNKSEGNTVGASDNTSFIFAMLGAAGVVIGIVAAGIAVVASMRPNGNGNGNGNGYTIEHEPVRRRRAAAE
jgi:hypothetical protein